MPGNHHWYPSQFLAARMVGQELEARHPVRLQSKLETPASPARFPLEFPQRPQRPRVFALRCRAQTLLLPRRFLPSTIPVGMICSVRVPHLKQTWALMGLRRPKPQPWFLMGPRRLEPQSWLLAPIELPELRAFSSLENVCGEGDCAPIALRLSCIRRRSLPE